jgi:hypothetical protein
MLAVLLLGLAALLVPHPAAAATTPGRGSTSVVAGGHGSLPPAVTQRGPRGAAVAVTRQQVEPSAVLHVAGSRLLPDLHGPSAVLPVVVPVPRPAGADGATPRPELPPVNAGGHRPSGRSPPASATP